MDPAESLRVVLDGAQAFGWTLETGQAELLLAFLHGILAENRAQNLTAVRNPEEGVQRHLLDSLAFGLHVAEAGPAGGTPSWLDFGTGGGFPGVVAAIAAPRATVHLVESRGRKIEAVARVTRALGLGNLRFHHARLAEALAADRGLRNGVDLVLVRGVASLRDIVHEAAPALRPSGGVLICWKTAPLPDAERQPGLLEACRRGLATLPDLPYHSFKPCVLVRYCRQESEHGP